MRLRRLLLSLVIGHWSLIISSAAPLDPARYPLSSELVLAELPADVQPIRSVRVKSPTDGLLTLRLPPPGQRLPEGAIWGEFDPERLQLEGDALALARALFEEKERPKLDLDLARNATELAERRAELRRQTDMLAKIATDPALAELYAAETTSSAGGPEIAALATRLDQQLQLIDQLLLYVGTPRETELERRSLELKLQAQELDFARRLREFRLVMPFAAELTLIPPPPADGGPLRVPLGADLALLRDFSAIQARVPLRRAEWRTLDPARLQLRHSPRGRPGLVATFERSLLQEISGREELLYIFQFPESSRSAARSLSGGQVAMQLVLRLDEPARIIPKIDLILAAPAAFRDEGWEAGVAAALPGARLLALGETHLAVVVP